MIRREPWEKFLERYRGSFGSVNREFEVLCNCGEDLVTNEDGWLYALNRKSLREHWQLGHFDMWEESAGNHERELGSLNDRVAVLEGATSKDLQHLIDRVKEIEFWMVEFRKATDAALRAEDRIRNSGFDSVYERLRKLESQNPITIDGKPGHALTWKLVVRFMLVILRSMPEATQDYNSNNLHDDLERLLKTL